jgi:hypothetical protein
MRFEDCMYFDCCGDADPNTGCCESHNEFEAAAARAEKAEDEIAALKRKVEWLRGDVSQWRARVEANEDVRLEYKRLRAGLDQMADQLGVRRTYGIGGVLAAISALQDRERKS